MFIFVFVLLKFNTLNRMLWLSQMFFFLLFIIHFLQLSQNISSLNWHIQSTYILHIFLHSICDANIITNSINTQNPLFFRKSQLSILTKSICFFRIVEQQKQKKNTNERDKSSNPGSMSARVCEYDHA